MGSWARPGLPSLAASPSQDRKDLQTRRLTLCAPISITWEHMRQVAPQPHPVPAGSGSASQQQRQGLLGCEKRWPMGREQSWSVPTPGGQPALCSCILPPPPGSASRLAAWILSVLIPALSTHELLSGLIRMMYMKALRKL